MIPKTTPLSQRSDVSIDDVHWGQDRELFFRREEVVLRWNLIDPPTEIFRVKNEREWVIDKGRLAVSDYSWVKFYHSDGQRAETLFIQQVAPDASLHAFAISPDGHIAPDATDDVVYTAVTAAGEYLTLAPAEFQKRFAWKNDKSRVRFGVPLRD